ncbi:hypothetical protein SCHPADRAFT_944567 [Schizopora paradoxa]|uniref:F-box domain-containing protein n=1 Tax=Schizopora paradoxa TaxID=27342 RepID=A0A0H2RA78_9AGAM|nr:hypothetical protein SCHPADRAFT_944567 [Schizopora paradoxa]
MRTRQRPRRDYELIGLSNVLKTLEEAARTPNVHSVDLRKIFGQENWSGVQNFGSKGLFTEDADRRLVDADSIARFMASAFEMDMMVSMLDVLMEVAKGLQRQFRISQETIAAKLSRGIKSLPTELLSKIFQFVVWEQGENGGIQAIRLSHVSRSFRTITLETRGLWTTLHSSDAPHQLETFLSRSGLNEEFHAVIHFDRRAIAFGISHFVILCQSVISRWRTLTLTQEDHDWPVSGGVNKNLKELFTLFSKNNSRLLSLEELDIRGDWDDRHNNSGNVNYEWGSSLRTCRCSYFLPAPSASFSSVSTFIFTQDIYHPETSLRPFLEFLPAMPNLTKLDLELYSADAPVFPESPRLEELPELPHPGWPSITSLHLQLRNFHLDDCEAKHSCIARLLDVLRTPSVDELFISVGLWGLSEDELDFTEYTQKLASLSRVLLPDHLPSYNRMSYMSFKLWIDEHIPPSEPQIRDPLDSRKLIIPLDRILHVPSVTLSSFIPIVFAQDTHSDNFVRDIDIDEQHHLRELKLVGCENLTSADLKQTVDSLESLDVWKDVKQVVVEDCPRLSQDEVVDVIGRERF